MRKKISVIGAGRVGNTTAFLAAYKEFGDIVLYNRTGDTAKGLALDIMQTGPLENFDANVIGTGNFEDTKDSDVVLITAGVQRQPGVSREQLLDENSKIVQSVTMEVAKYSPESVIIIITNPVDAMSYVAKKVSGFQRNRVIGMAGMLDTSRFRSFLSSELKVSVEDISALVLGGHGDFMVPLPSHSSVNGVPITQLLDKNKIDEIVDRTKNAGAEILSLEKDSSAFYAPAAALLDMTESILKDKKRVLPCAAYLEGEYGLKDIFMGVPVKLGSKGIEEIIEVELNRGERNELMKSAKLIKQLIAELKI